jgi:hypothetical protein
MLLRRPEAGSYNKPPESRLVLPKIQGGVRFSTDVVVIAVPVGMENRICYNKVVPFRFSYRVRAAEHR